MRLAVKLGGLELQNPVLVASGCFGYGEEYDPFFDLNRLGAIVVKGVTLKPRAGHPPPRLWETPAGMLNAIGLQNPGLEGFLTEKLPYLRRLTTKVIVNIMGDEVAEYRAVANGLAEVEGVHALEVNISCPNVAKGGMEFGTDPRATFDVVSAVRAETTKPLLVKLSPNAGDLLGVAKAAQEAGADALSLVNTFLGIAIDVETRKPRLANITGGLSGPAIRPLAVRMVWEVARAVRLPVVGLGGILHAEDALEFILAGATAVGLGTGLFVNPRAPLDVLDGLVRYMEHHGVADIQDLVGRLDLST